MNYKGRELSISKTLTFISASGRKLLLFPSLRHYASMKAARQAWGPLSSAGDCGEAGEVMQVQKMKLICNVQMFR